MKPLSAAFLAIVSIAASAQTLQPAPLRAPQTVQTMCRGPAVTTGPDYDKVQRIVTRLANGTKDDQRHQVFFVLANNPEINAWTVNVQDLNHSVVCVPTSIVEFMGEGDGELAFVIAHEAGHAIDDVCKTPEGRTAVARQRGSLGALIGEIAGGEKGAYQGSTLSQQRGCEERADELGFRMFVRAGYNPYDAAGAFGRLEMYLGDTSTGVFARFANLASSHPITPDRIRHMRMLLISR